LPEPEKEKEEEDTDNEPMNECFTTIDTENIR
jgi:hypothetical protein